MIEVPNKVKKEKRIEEDMGKKMMYILMIIVTLMSMISATNAQETPEGSNSDWFDCEQVMDWRQLVSPHYWAGTTSWIENDTLHINFSGTESVSLAIPTHENLMGFMICPEDINHINEAFAE